MSIADIVESPYFTLALAGIAILGLLLTIVFYRKSRRRKLPLFEIARRTLIQNRTPLITGLSVHFKGQEQNVITVAHVWFWNQGDDTINASDIASANPVAISVARGVDLLDVQIIKVVDKANRCEIGEPEQEDDGSFLIPLRFDYLDKGDGLVVQIVHNGETRHHVTVTGKIKGVDHISLAADSHALHVETSSRTRHMMAVMDKPRVAGVISILVMAGGGVALGSAAMGGGLRWLLWIPASLCFLLALACYPIYLRRLIPRALHSVIEAAADGQPSSESERGESSMKCHHDRSA
ncbi:MAG: hypothetical protein K9N49_06850 [Candidatus Marinimicrobia bacterium]|nr:hypothetical protein [Candidatus Neomarinimicrobiota bacterium]